MWLGRWQSILPISFRAGFKIQTSFIPWKYRYSLRHIHNGHLTNHVSIWQYKVIWKLSLTHWGRVTHICVGNLAIIGSDNGLSPGRRQAITWTNVGILLIGPFGTNVSEILSRIEKFPFKKMHLKMSSAKWRPFCLGLNLLRLSNHCHDSHQS